jgi:mannose-6-phosphate isomerase-like protein (cupin superfamily)
MDGETQMTPLELPMRDTSVGRVRSITGIPAITAGVGHFVNGRKPDTGMHTAPRRELLVVLEGELEITTSTGHQRRLGAGDVMLADDVGTKGHISRDVGEDHLMLLAIGVDPSWAFPSPE